MKALVPLVLLAASLAGCASGPTTETDSNVRFCPQLGTGQCHPCDGAAGGAGVAECLEACGDAQDVEACVAAWRQARQDPPAEAPALPWHPSDGAAEAVDMLLAGAGGHEVPVTVYRPLVAGPDATVPVILHSHGWAGTRTSTPEAFVPVLAAGFGVVSIDMRGHGEAAAASEANVHRIEYEIADVSAVIDQVATWDWVHLDGPGDPRLGAMGGSYGGGYQLLVAALDDRLDAIAPEITWHDLLGSLAPDGAPKSAWIDLLYWGAHARGTTLSQQIHEAYLWLQATNLVPDGSHPGQPDIATPFAASSPASYAGAIDIPALFIQGAPDTLFPFNEAVRNHAMVNATGAPVRLVTHLNGHILNTEGTIPDPGAPQPVGLQPPAAGYPCGDNTEMAIAWFERHLIGRTVETGPGVCLALEDGTVVEGPSYPLPGTTWQSKDLGDATVPIGPRALPIDLPVLSVDEETVVAGIPRLRGSAESPGPDAIVYWRLDLVRPDGDRHTVLSQVTPMRLGGGGPFDTELLGLAVRLLPGDALVLVATDRSDQYLHNESRVPGAVLFSALEIDLPVVAPADG